jgi:hypothetical protein
MITLGKRRRPLQSHDRLLVAALLAVVSIGAASVAKAADDNVNVTIDQAQIVRLDRPAAEIIVGNPSIADVSVQSGKVLVVTGKSYGRTNLIVIDSDGKQVVNKYLSVTEPGAGYVMMHKGIDPVTYFCAPNCSPALSVGDRAEDFDKLQKQISAKQSMGQSSAEGSKPGE